MWATLVAIGTSGKALPQAKVLAEPKLGAVGNSEGWWCVEIWTLWGALDAVDLEAATEV